VFVILILGLLSGASVVAQDTADPEVLKEGKSLAFNRQKGNCLSCHMVEDGDQPGNQGPPLVAMKQRFPEKSQLRAQIWDPTVKNPHTMMPPFGKHGILSEDELDKVVEYIYSL
jgi:sulfur-oxidizing protein SoxX